MQQIIFHKLDVPESLLGREPLWFDSCKRPLSLCIFGGRLHRRTGGGGGGARGATDPPKFWATQLFWAARENLGKASF